MTTERVRIADIVVGDRVRKDLGDLIGLAASINELGLLHPPIITPDRRLVAGERRIAAARDILDWTEIDCTVADNLKTAARLLKAEEQENRERADLNVEEKVEMARRLTALKAPEAAARQAETRFGEGEPEETKDGGAKPDTTAKTSETRKSESKTKGSPKGRSGGGKTRDEVATAVGMGRTNLTKATEVVDAAKADPSLRPIVDEMNATGKVEPAYRAVQAKINPATEDPLVVVRRDAFGHLHAFDKAAVSYSELGGPIDLQKLQKGTRLCRDAFDAAPEPEVPPILTFPCAGAVKEWGLTQEQIDEWQGLYPAADVLGECRKALGWIKTNTMKTAKGMPKFLTRWLGKAQDEGRGGRGAKTAPDKMAGFRAASAPSRRGTQVAPGVELIRKEDVRDTDVPF